MSKFICDVKQLKMNKFIKSIWHLIISTSNATLDVPLLLPCIFPLLYEYFDFFEPSIFSTIFSVRWKFKKSRLNCI